MYKHLFCKGRFHLFQTIQLKKKHISFLFLLQNVKQETMTTQGYIQTVSHKCFFFDKHIDKK